MLIRTTLHSGPTGADWMAFIAECNERPQHPHERDGAASVAGAAGTPPTVVAAFNGSQPAPSPQPTTTGGVGRG